MHEEGLYYNVNNHFEFFTLLHNILLSVFKNKLNGKLSMQDQFTHFSNDKHQVRPLPIDCGTAAPPVFSSL